MNMKNCWEVTGCLRQSGGALAACCGVCPSSLATEHDGINRGVNGGRYCWRVTGTFCDGQPSGVMASKVANCGQCPFFHQVIREEGVDFVL